MSNQKNLVLRKKINDVIYDLMIKTVTEQVYSTDGTKTLDTIISELETSIASKASSKQFTELETKFNNLITDAPEAYDTLKEIATFISTHNDEYTALVAISSAKVDKVDGKGLSSNDLTDDLLTKLNSIYDKATMDEKFTQITERVETLETSGGKGGIVCVDSIAERDTLLTSETKYAGMIVYVAGKAATETEEAVAAAYYSLSDDLATWVPFTGSLSQQDMESVLSYVQSNLEHSKYEEGEDGTAYLTLL